MSALPLTELQAFFNSAQWPETPERRPTFFSIAGFPHYENVLSNVYAFFFRSDEPHGLGNLCLDALVDVLRSKKVDIPWSQHDFRTVYALREVGMRNQQRLDLLLHNGSTQDDWQTASAVLLIENKVYHWLANDLNNYQESVKEKNPDSHRLGLVLGPRRELAPEGWIFVSHYDWAVAVERRLGTALSRAEPRYVTLLLEVLENIRAMSNPDENFAESLSFFLRNRAAISRAEKIRKEVYYRVPGVVREHLSAYYQVYWNAEANHDGWLNISLPGEQPLRYILGYSGVFDDDMHLASYNITLINNKEGKSSPEWQQDLAPHLEQSMTGVKADSTQSYHILTKNYPLDVGSCHLFPQLVANNLRQDWQPLEPYWRNTDPTELTAPQ